MYVEMKHIEKKLRLFPRLAGRLLWRRQGKASRPLRAQRQRQDDDPAHAGRLENPNSGDIVIDGKRVNDIPAAKRGIGFVFQNYALFRYMTVFDNVAFGLTIQGMKKRRYPRAGPGDDRPRRPCRHGRALSQSALRRPASARRLCPGPGASSPGLAPR